MDGVTDTAAEIEQYMKDIGCDMKTAEEFKEADKKKRIRILKLQRRTLMNRVHEDQKRVDRVDFIIDRLECDRNG